MLIDVFPAITHLNYFHHFYLVKYHQCSDPISFFFHFQTDENKRQKKM